MILGAMPTRTLKLRKCSDGYYRTSWTTESGRRLSRSFGKVPHEAELAFAAFHNEWYTDATVRDPEASRELTVQQAFDRYVKHADTHYRHNDGSPTREADNVRDAMRPMLELFGGKRARDMDVRALERARDRMIKAKLARTTINDRVNRIRRVFRWFASRQIVPASVWGEMKALEGLKPGRSEAVDPDPVRPVPGSYIEAVKAELPAVICAMIDVQLLTGARPGEVCVMRPIDIDTTNPVWAYRPVRHKSSHLGRGRVIMLGPRAQEAVNPFLARPVEAWCFSPREALRERYDARGTHRRANQKKSPTKTTRKVGEQYTTNTYAQAISRACKAAGIERWGPNRLRHNAATAVSQFAGLAAAQVVLGHAKADVTQIYAEKDAAAAAAVMAQIG